MPYGRYWTSKSEEFILLNVGILSDLWPLAPAVGATVAKSFAYTPILTSGRQLDRTGLRIANSSLSP